MQTWKPLKLFPSDPKYFEVHFYQDGHIEVAITPEASPPRLKLERADGGWRHADHSKTIINDDKFGVCKRGSR